MGVGWVRWVGAGWGVVVVGVKLGQGRAGS